MFTITANTMRFDTDKTTVIITEENKELTIENIVKYMNEIELDHKDILLAQIHLETGNLKYIKHENNLFGFRAKSYLTFDTWEDCIDMMKEWQNKHWVVYKEKHQSNDYYKFLLHKRYAEDVDYIKKLKQISKIYNYVRK